MSARHRRRSLIPRNNWDYGWAALSASVASAFRKDTPTPDAARVFGQEPIWTNTGRTALYAILRALNLPPGGAVAVPLFCCPVVFDAIRRAGLVPRFIDSSMEDGNLAVDDLARKRDGLAAVVVVHLFGRPCDMDSIEALGLDVPIIEDCAQSLFSHYKGRPTGSLGSASFFSFRCGKYVSAGEGGAILCRDPDLRVRIERTVSSFQSAAPASLVVDSVLTFVKATFYHRPWYGLIGRPIGMRLDEKLNLTAKTGFRTGRIAPTHQSLIEARIGRFHERIDVQRDHAHHLLDALEPGAFRLPPADDERESNWFQFALRFPDSQRRDAMAEHLLRQGIDTASYLDGHPDAARTSYGYSGDCPNAEALSESTLLVPIYYTLSAVDMQYIARSINEGARVL